jgi:hypothetical protein
LKTRKNVDSESFLKDITTHDITLVSNTLFKEVYLKTVDTKIRWKRIYIDEADTIEIKSSYINDLSSSYCNFIWFITASFINLLFISNYSLFLSQLFINRYLESNQIDNEFRELIHKNFNTQHQSLRLFITNRSTRFLSYIINKPQITDENRDEYNTVLSLLQGKPSSKPFSIFSRGGKKSRRPKHIQKRKTYKKI